jgi:hypothetical protein
MNRSLYQKYEGPNQFRLDIVGESFKESNIQKVTKNHPDGHAVATLNWDILNENDNKAISVIIDGYEVGYLSRENARQYHKMLKNLQLNEDTKLVVDATFHQKEFTANTGIWLDFGVLLKPREWQYILDTCTDIKMTKEEIKKSGYAARGCFTFIFGISFVILIMIKSLI